MKIKHTNLNKIIDKCTGKEIDFILEISQYQDERGNINGIDYKTICENIKICKGTFFKLLNDLQSKDIIKINYMHQEYSFWNIELVDNDFTDKETYKEGYLNINNTFLHSKDFMNYTRGEKVIVLNLFKIANNRHSVRITMETLIKWTGYKRQAIIRYFKRLKKHFTITIENNLFTFFTNSHFFVKPGSEKDIRNSHLINYLTKKNKASKEQNSVSDVAKLFNQYSKLEPTIIFDIIEKSLKSIGILSVRYIHKYLSNYLKYTQITY